MLNLWRYIVRSYDIEHIGENEYQVTFRIWHPTHWYHQLAVYLGFETTVYIESLPEYDK